MATAKYLNTTATTATAMQYMPYPKPNDVDANRCKLRWHSPSTAVPYTTSIEQQQNQLNQDVYQHQQRQRQQQQYQNQIPRRRTTTVITKTVTGEEIEYDIPLLGDYDVPVSYNMPDIAVSAASTEYVPSVPQRTSYKPRPYTLKSPPPLPPRNFQDFRNTLCRATQLSLINHYPQKPFNYYSPTEFNQLEILGEGSYGIVYKAVQKTTNVAVAIKKYKRGIITNDLHRNFLREVSILNQLDHPNIIKMHGLITTPEQLCIIFEHLKLDMHQYLSLMPKPAYLPQERVRRYMYQLCLAINYCHKRKVMHRDLKPSNLLLDRHGNLKVADFGMGRSFSLPVGTYTTEVVTLWYRAPELLLGQHRYTNAIDIWAMGCIFAELIQKTALFPGQSPINQLHQIVQTLTTPTEISWPNVTKLKHYPFGFPPYTRYRLNELVPRAEADAYNLLRHILVYDPARRYNTDDILEHHYFRNMHFRT